MKFAVDISRKGISLIPLPRTSTQLVTLLPRTSFDYEAEVGKGRQSAIIMACVRWIQRTFPEAPVMLERMDKDKQWQRIYQHSLLSLLDEPNSYYDGLLLQAATISDLALSGNAYWIKLRSSAGRVVQLWWIPSSLIAPKWPQEQQDIFISHYEYKPGYQIIKVRPEDVVHFREGIDSDNIRKGLSPIKSLFREIFTDDEASNMTASLLKNMGVPGMVIAPEQGGMGMPQDVKATKEWFKQQFTGDYRGEPLVMSGPTKVQPFTLSPKDMSLKELRRIPEERISGVLGIPAIVAGLGAGLDRSTFSNYAEAREAAYESNIIPMQRLTASVIKRSLLGEFEDDLSSWRVGYDLSEIRVLQEDEDKKAGRVGGMVKDGFLKVNDAQRLTGVPVDESQDYYLRPFNVVAVSGEASPARSSKKLGLKAKLNDEQKRAFWQDHVAKAENYEKQLIISLRAMFKEQEKEALKSIKGGKTENFINPVKAQQSYTEKVIPILTEHIQRTVRDAMNLVTLEPHKSLKQEELISMAALIWLRSRIGWAAQEIGEHTALLLSNTLGEGFANGESIPKLSKRVRNTFDFCSRHRAERIARTETMAASAEGAIVGYGDAGVERLELYPAPDACENCLALAGEYPINETRGMLPVHPMCRCIWTPVIV